MFVVVFVALVTPQVKDCMAPFDQREGTQGSRYSEVVGCVGRGCAFEFAMISGMWDLQMTTQRSSWRYP